MVSAAKERTMLLEHGTRAFEIKPGSIVAAAAADLRLREQKLEGNATARQPYAFHRTHVRKASTPQELLQLALMDRAKGDDSAKLNTRRIYGDEELLRAALSVATPPPTLRRKASDRRSARNTFCERSPESIRRAH